MKLRNSFVTAGFAALALAGATVLGSAESAQAMGLSFTPSGTIADADPIRDLVRAPGSPITFDLKFDTGNLDLDTDVITQIVLDFGFDSDELTPPPSVVAPGGTIGVAATAGHIYSLTYNNLNISGDTGFHTLGQVAFTLGSLLPNDGIRDFFTTLRVVKGTASGNFNDFMLSEVAAGNSIQIYKQLEVQSPTPVPTPALLPGLAAFGMSLVRKRKQEQAA